MKKQWFRFKTLYSSSGNNAILFDSFVCDSNTYRVNYDENGLFTDTFIDIIKGKCKLYKKIDNNYNNFQELHINEQNAIDNLKKYMELTKGDNSTVDIIEPVDLSNILTGRFKGPDFNYDQGMNPPAFNRANNIIYGLSKIFNDILHEKEQFVLQKAGSLVYELYAPSNKVNKDIKKYILKVVENDIKSINKNERYIIYNISKYLYDLKKIKNLDCLELVFGDNDSVFVDIDNVEKTYMNTRKESIKIKKTPDSYSNKNKSFKMGKYSCYLPEHMEDMINEIKNMIENKETVEVYGKLKANHDNTIIVEKIMRLA